MGRTEGEMQMRELAEKIVKSFDFPAKEAWERWDYLGKDSEVEEYFRLCVEAEEMLAEGSTEKDVLAKLGPLDTCDDCGEVLADDDDFVVFSRNANDWGVYRPCSECLASARPCLSGTFKTREAAEEHAEFMSR